MSTVLTTSEEQAAFNQQQCDTCQLQRWQHVNAILCTEAQPTPLEILQAVNALRAEIAPLVQFVEQLKTAIESHPLARQMFGG